MLADEEMKNKSFDFDLQRFDGDENQDSDGNSDSDNDSDSEVEQWTFENNAAFYGTTNTVFVTVDGVISTDGLTIDTENKIVTVAASSLSQDLKVIISNGYTLALGEDVTTASLPTLIGDWTFRGSDTTIGRATATVSATTAGYTLKDNQISYEEAKKQGTIIVSGVTSADGLTLDGKTIIVSEEALYNLKSAVRLSPDDYTLALAEGVTKPEFVDGEWLFIPEENLATYLGSFNEAGYVLAQNKIYHVRSSEEKTVEITGVTSENGITKNGNTFIIPASILTKSDVTINESFNLQLGEDVQKPMRTKAGWSFDEENLTANYKETSISEGYTLDEFKDKITYSAETGGEVLVGVKGINSTEAMDALEINTESKIITVYGKALIQNNDIEIDETEDESAYTLQLNDESKYAPKSLSDQWYLSEQKASYVKGEGTGEGFIVEDGKKIKYVPMTAENISVELDGISNLPTFKDSEEEDADNDASGIIQLTEENFGEEESVSLISNSGGYQIEISGESYGDEAKFIGSASGDTVTNNGQLDIDGGAGNDYITNNATDALIEGGAGRDKINNTGSNVTITGGAGNDNISISSGASGNVFIYSSGDGNDKLVNFTSNDTIKIADSETPIITANVQGDNVVLDIGNGSITFKDGAISDNKIRIIDAAGNVIDSISGNNYKVEGVIKDDTIRLATNFKDRFNGEYKADNVSTVDGSQLEEGISINAGLEGTSILGGVGKDTLISGDQDFSFRGGNGNDVFVYNGGFNGRIEDYSISGKTGKDRVSIDWDNFKEYEITTENLILTFNDEKTLIIDGVKNTNVTFLIPGTTKTKVSSFNDDAIFSSKGKLAEVGYNPNAKRKDAVFDGTQNSKTVTIDASNANYEINLIGNKKANLITAGSDGSTINGKRGKDTLIGGAESDIFVYEKNSGNKVIRNYEYYASGGDVISLQSGVKITDIADKDGNRILSVGKNKITLEGGASLEAIKFDDGTEKIAKESMLMTLVDGKENSVSLTSGFSATDSINISETGNYSDKDWLNLDASDRKKGLSITGDTQANSLIGSKGNDIIQGGDGDDFINGGAGNDELWGDDGADTFTFYVGNGTDTIGDFGGDDMIRILDTNGRAVNFKGKYNSSKDILTLSVNGGGKVLITGLADRLEDGQSVEDLTLNINGSHKISGKKLK